MLPGRVKRERRPLLRSSAEVQVTADGGWRPVDRPPRAVAVEPDISEYVNHEATPIGPGSKDAPQRLGEVAMVGEWAVTVSAFTPGATVEIMSVNPFNDPPSEGVYSMAMISVTYQGDTEGSAYSDLRFVLRGGDAVQYADAESITVLPQALSDTHTLEAGGRATGDVSFDCPVAALSGATLFVERILDFDSATRRYWLTA